MNFNKRILLNALSVMLLLSAAVFSGEFTGGAPIPLPPDGSFDIDFTVNARSDFNVRADAGEAVEITCDRRGAETAMSVALPDGPEITASNGPFSFAAKDRVFFVAPSTGDYRLTVGLRRGGPKAGGCLLKRLPTRAATDADRLTATAGKTAADARRLLFGSEKRLSKANDALKLIDAALADFERSGDLRGRADAMFLKAQIVGDELGRKLDAIEVYKQTLELYDKLDDDAGRAVAYRFLGDETRDLDSQTEKRQTIVARAHGYFARAVELDRRLGDRLGEAATLTYRCRLYNDNGGFQEGLEDCRAALRLGANLEPIIGYRTYMNLASLASNSGDNDTAQKNNKIALERLDLVRDYVSPAREAFIRTNIGWLYMESGNFSAAMSNLRAALKITEELERMGQTAKILVALSRLAQNSGRFDDAIKHAERAVEIYRSYDPSKIQAALNSLGLIRQALGERDAARALFTEAVEVNQRNGDRYAEADSLYNLAQLEAADSHIDLALQTVRAAITRSEIIRAALYGQRQRTSYLTILRKYYDLEFNLLWRLNDDRRDPALVERAWQVNEKLRARALLETLTESGLVPMDAAPAGFYQRQRELLEAIASAEINRATVLSNPVAASRADADLLRLISNFDELREESRRTNPRFSVLNDPPDMSTASARAMLDNDTVVLEFALGENRSGVWVFRRDEYKFVPLPSRSVVEAAARAYYIALIDRDSKPRTTASRAATLSQLIVVPLAAEIAGRRRIILITDGILQTIPFAALSASPDRDARPLASDYEISGAPSFATLASIRERRPSVHDKAVAVFADPIFQRDDERLEKAPKIAEDPSDKIVHSAVDAARREIGIARLGRLPFSAFEANTIAGFATDRSFVATGARASRESFLQGDFGSYKILHFATHGFINEDHPELSGIVLSLYDEDRRAQNGFLRAIDLYSTRLNNDLVVLSACQTALGRDVTGEGIVGLSRAFLYAGSRSVVSSLWKIDDAASAEFMGRFYGAMLKDGKSPSEALRIAQNAMRQIPRYSEPRYWAGFILIGDWR